MKTQIFICLILVFGFNQTSQAEPHKVDFSKTNMDGWTSQTSSKTISYQKKRYISGGGGGRWVTDWQKNKKSHQTLSLQCQVTSRE